MKQNCVSRCHYIAANFYKRRALHHAFTNKRKRSFKQFNQSVCNITDVYRAEHASTWMHTVTSSIEAGRHNSDHKLLNYQLQIFNMLYFKNSFTSSSSATSSSSSATSSSSSATSSLSSSSSVTSVSKYVVFYTYHAFVSYDVFIIGDVFSIVNDVIITKTPLTRAIY